MLKSNYLSFCASRKCYRKLIVCKIMTSTRESKTVAQIQATMTEPVVGEPSLLLEPQA